MMASGRCFAASANACSAEAADGDGMALGGQGALKRPADGFFVIDDQDMFHGTPRVVEVAGIGLIMEDRQTMSRKPGPRLGARMPGPFPAMGARAASWNKWSSKREVRSKPRSSQASHTPLGQMRPGTVTVFGHA